MLTLSFLYRKKCFKKIKIKFKIGIIKK